MRVKGRENPQYGFQNPSPGWHRMVIQEGIDFYKKDGEVVLNDKGNKRIIINMAVDGGEEDGRRVSHWIGFGTEFGEQQVADLLVVTGLAKKFEEKFPGEVSLFDPKVYQAIVMKLPGQFLMVNVTHRKGKDDTVNANVFELAKIGAKIKGKDVAAKPAPAPESAPAGTTAPETEEAW
jgi:hypothetical protein